jgi:hypothetical protein
MQIERVLMRFQSFYKSFAHRKIKPYRQKQKKENFLFAKKIRPCVNDSLYCFDFANLWFIMSAENSLTAFTRNICDIYVGQLFIPKHITGEKNGQVETYLEIESVDGFGAARFTGDNFAEHGAERPIDHAIVQKRDQTLRRI